MSAREISCLPRCSVCGVEYVEDYEGPCREKGGHLSDAVYVRRLEGGVALPVCPGTVSWLATAEALSAVARENEERAKKAEARLQQAREALEGLTEWTAVRLGLEGIGAVDSDTHVEPFHCVLNVQSLRLGLNALRKARAALALLSSGEETAG